MELVPRIGEWGLASFRPSVPPLDRATHARGLLRWAAAGHRDLRHRLEKLAPLGRRVAHTRGIEPATVLQLVIGVEAKEIRRALRTIGACDLLGVVDHARQGAAGVAREPL